MTNDNNHEYCPDCGREMTESDENRIHAMEVMTGDGYFDVYAEEIDGKMGPVHLAYSPAMAGTPTLAWLKENLPDHIFHGVEDRED